MKRPTAHAANSQKTHALQNVGVVGAGAWGTALANMTALSGKNTVIWAREDDVVTAINKTHENTVFLSGHTLHKDLRATTDMASLNMSDVILIVSPAQHLRTAAKALKQHINPAAPILICSKGIEVSTGKFMSDVLSEEISNPVGVLSGPTFAAEVVQNLPCALTLAVADENLALSLVRSLGMPNFRPYTSTDIIGAQVGGAIKNILAIATGIVVGLGLGENARAAVITRGLAEIVRFGLAFGAKRETLMGLSGLGDLMLTCSSTQSRNMSLGKAIGEGRSLSDIMQERNSVAEGAHTVDIVYKTSKDRGISMPIVCAVYKILKEGQDAQKVTNDLLSRPFIKEAD